MKKLIIVGFLLISAVSFHAQDLYMPRNVKMAYAAGTRSMDGKPGKNYWQNTADYNISISLDPASRMVTGTEEIIYKNNSPHEISNPAIRLTMNIHRPGAVREGPASEDYLTDGISIDEFKENGVAKEWKDRGFTVQTVNLSKKVAPGETVKLSFRWHYELSKESGREGMIHKNSFFLAYFYPRVAVFDDIDGWDRVPFTESHEFYNDFNNYVFQV
ncbi:MAG: M1 family peptidase, partial [Acidobacteria bacterium]|nr:M1 family peptidase [Acidobacteriota bacterium]